MPNERVPRMVARFLVLQKAPATISDAEAEPPLINTIKRFAFGEIPTVGSETPEFLRGYDHVWKRSRLFE